MICCKFLSSLFCSGALVVKRQPLLPKVLSVSNAVESARKPFKSPCPGANTEKKLELQRRLHARKRFVPWGSREALSPITNVLLEPSPLQPAVEVDKVEELPPGIDPLVLWEAELDDKSDRKCAQIVVDPRLVRFLRPHQRYGAKLWKYSSLFTLNVINCDRCLKALDLFIKLVLVVGLFSITMTITYFLKHNLWDPVMCNQLIIYLWDWGIFNGTKLVVHCKYCILVKYTERCADG